MRKVAKAQPVVSPLHSVSCLFSHFLQLIKMLVGWLSTLNCHSSWMSVWMCAIMVPCDGLITHPGCIPTFFFPLTIFLKDGNHMIIWKSLIWNWSALLWAPPLCHGSTHTIMVIQFSISTWHSTVCLAVEIQTKPINLLRLATLFNGKHYLKKGSIQHPP